MIELPESASMKDFQAYIEALEQKMDWRRSDLQRNAFLMGEEVGELFKAIRRTEKGMTPAVREEVAHEIVDVFNYLLAIANRLDIDVEKAFREKNLRNQSRTW